MALLTLQTLILYTVLKLYNIIGYILPIETCLNPHVNYTLIYNYLYRVYANMKFNSIGLLCINNGYVDLSISVPQSSR